MSKREYDHKKIERYWAEKWMEVNLYQAEDFSPKPKKYILAELPYPSGKSLHVGHAMRYTVPEMYSRFLRMKGYNVLFPMGWDAFGLPTEVFALKNNTTPQEVTKLLALDYKKAMAGMGYAIDWNREINTTDKDYYKWTQWLFLNFYEHNLAVLKEMPVWWSETLGILADEELVQNENGEKVAERDGSKVQKKKIKQWVLKLPEYAEKLLEGLNEVDFQEHIKTAQRNWIGKSEGLEIEFSISARNDSVLKNSPLLKVFTTRPDTIYGVTFVALAPEHPLVAELTKASENPEQINEFVSRAKNTSDMERQAGKTKNGIQVKGVFAISPVENKQIPIFIADYILMDYGTGAIMGVPAHDERDYDFATKYKIEIVQVIDEEKQEMLNSGQYTGSSIVDFKKEITQKLVKAGLAKEQTRYKVRDWVFSRQRYWGEPIPVIYKKDGSVETISKLPVELPYSTDYEPLSDGRGPLAKVSDWVNTLDSAGEPAQRETQTMPTWAGSSWYFLRYLDPHNSECFADFEKLKYWMPVDRYFGGSEHTTVHLLYSRFWYRFFYDIRLVPTKEPYQWRMNGGLLLGPDGNKMSKRLGNVIEPGVLIENYGADATRIAIAFLGPYSETYPWNPNGMKAAHRLVRTIYDMADKVKPDDQITTSSSLTLTERNINVLIKNITHMCEDLKMNTCISEIMIFVNYLKSVEEIPLKVWSDFVKVIAPFIPFAAEELWQELNQQNSWDKEKSVHLQKWPEYDPSKLKEEYITIPVQINGRIKGEVKIKPEFTQEQVLAAALEVEPISKNLTDKKLEKVIYAKGKIISLVTA